VLHIPRDPRLEVVRQAAASLVRDFPGEGNVHLRQGNV